MVNSSILLQSSASKFRRAQKPWSFPRLGIKESTQWWERSWPRAKRAKNLGFSGQKRSKIDQKPPKWRTWEPALHFTSHRSEGRKSANFTLLHFEIFLSKTTSTSLHFKIFFQNHRFFPLQFQLHSRIPPLSYDDVGASFCYFAKIWEFAPFRMPYRTRNSMSRTIQRHSTRTKIVICSQVSLHIWSLVATCWPAITLVVGKLANSKIVTRTINTRAWNFTVRLVSFLREDRVWHVLRTQNLSHWVVRRPGSRDCLSERALISLSCDSVADPPLKELKLSGQPFFYFKESIEQRKHCRAAKHGLRTTIHKVVSGNTDGHLQNTSDQSEDRRSYSVCDQQNTTGQVWEYGYLVVGNLFD